MESEITYSIWDRKISWADALVTIGKLLKKRGFEPNAVDFRSKIIVNPIKTLSLDTLDETVEVLRRIQAFQLLQCWPMYRRQNARGKSQSA